MSNSRTSKPVKSPYITAAGYKVLEAEAKGLWKRRAEVTKALAASAAEGDRSENAEYIYRKKELREIDRRIRYLQKRMPDLRIVDSVPVDRARIFFGAWVTLSDEQNIELAFRIVGPDELDPKRGLISMDAPLAKAMMGRTVDDEVFVRTPGGHKRYWILEVSYEAL